MKPKVAIVCDWFVSRGGAERVISAIAEVFPDAPIYTSLYDKKQFPEFEDKEIITSFIQKLPFATRRHPFFLPFMPYAFEEFNLSKYEIVISSCHSCSKGVITKPGTIHICYCHSPMRYAWDNCHEYFENYGIPKLLQGRAKKMLHGLRLWDRVAADRVDEFIANSEHVKKRISKYYRRASTVIYPPVNTDKFTVSTINGRYFLALGRLTAYKRFDLLIDTFNNLQIPLVIAGTGNQEQSLKRRSGRFITFLGKVPEGQLNELYGKATALVFPQEEDFGITPLEAASCGRPVLAYAAGGALETVIPGKTGILFEDQSPQAIKKAVLECTETKWNAREIRKHAEKFDIEIFKKEFKHFVDEKYAAWRKAQGP